MVQNAAILIVAIQSAVLVGIRVVPTVVLNVALIVALHAVRNVAVIQAVIPARDARSADFREAFREEFHAVVPKPAPVVRCVVRAHWPVERSQSLPVVARAFQETPLIKVDLE